MRMSGKRKKQRRRAKKAKIPLLACGCAFAGALTVALLYFGVLRSQEPALPLYEEGPGNHSILQSRIRDIERAVYECLYQGRVPEQGIYFSVLEAKDAQGDLYDITEILVDLPKAGSSQQLARRIIGALEDLKPAVTCRIKEVAPGELLCHVIVEGLYTHRIRIRSGTGDLESLRRLPRIALIIDDLGQDFEIVRALMALDLPLTLSILPEAPQTAAIVREAQKRGSELMLHLPMEPRNFPSFNPGPGALLADMADEEIMRLLTWHLKQVPGARGVNNHMGSFFTERRDKMAVVLGELKRRHLYYIDSRTTKKTVAYTLAREMGVATANRNVFLDNDLSPKAMKFQMHRLMGLARASGEAIGIGHPHPKTIEMLKAYGPRIKKEFQAVHAGDLVS